MCDQHEFVFEFDKAYNHQLIEKFEASPEHPLAEDVGPRESQSMGSAVPAPVAIA